MSEHGTNLESPVAPKQGGLPVWAIGPAFLAVAAALVLFPERAEVPRGQMHIVSRDLIKPGAPRKHMGEPPRITMGGFELACNECHKLFNSPPVERRTLTQHTHIDFQHGMNNRCFNCHDRNNRERLVLHDGTLLKFDEVPKLCSQCHGTVYRDWQHGTHGKTMGSWDASSGKQIRLNCNDCHNPHSPAYKPIAPLPGPNTLRMGDQSRDEEPSRRHMPLRHWSLPEQLPTGEPGPTGVEEKYP